LARSAPEGLELAPGAAVPPARRPGSGPADLIGNTPLVRLVHTFPADGPAVYLKLEQFNPGGSVKDRTALGIIEHEERADRLKPPMTIIESSSGNTAIGLAILAKAKGYRVVAVCDRHLPVVKRARLRAFGADILYLPDTPVGMDTVELRIRLASLMADRLPDAVTLGQYSNPGNPEIHYRTTGPEIWAALEGHVSAVVAAVGTCGTISGVGRCVKERDQGVTVVGVEPEGSVIFGGNPGAYLVQGGGLSFVPPILDADVIDHGLKVADADTFAFVRETAHREGWMLGGTGGLVMAGIKYIVPQLGAGDTVVGIIPDGGDRYVETLFDEAWMAMHAGPEPAPSTPEDPLQAVAVELGCSVNEVRPESGPSLDNFASALGVELARHDVAGPR
jgi:cysteine synthase